MGCGEEDKYMSRFMNSGCAAAMTEQVEKFSSPMSSNIRTNMTKKLLPLWKEIEQEFQEKITNMTVAYRGIVIDQYDFT